MSLQIETQPFQFNNTVTGLSSAVFNSVSATALSGAFYGNGSNLTLPTNGTFTTLNILSTLNVAGSANFYNTSNLNVSAALIYFGEGNTANLLDLGIAAHFTGPLNNNNTSYQHTGFVRRANQGSPGTWTLFSGLTTEPGSYGANGINWNDPYITVDSLSANILGNLSGSYVTVGNGNSTQWNTAYSLVSGGTGPLTFNSTTSATKTLVGANSATGIFSGVLGGVCNTASGNYSTVVNGFSSCATGYATFVGAGSGIKATGNYAVAVGGQNNTASGCYSVVAGGQCNTASGKNSFIGAGNNLTASGAWSIVVGGRCNTASGNYSFVAGGSANDTKGFANTFILGTALSAVSANFTYVNNISSQGLVYDKAGNSALWTTIITNLTANGSTTISNPTGSYQDGQRLLYRVTQGGSGNNAITLDTQFRIPTSTSSPLAFSTAVGYMDMLGVMYNQPAGKWDVISFVPGYR